MVKVMIKTLGKGRCPSSIPKVIYTLAFVQITALSGCGVVAPPSQLTGPAKRCMVAPQTLKGVPVGGDLVTEYSAVAQAYGRETSKLRCLQKWVRTVTK